jgi:hypothetical protein
VRESGITVYVNISIDGIGTNLEDKKGRQGCICLEI